MVSRGRVRGVLLVAVAMGGAAFGKPQDREALKRALQETLKNSALQGARVSLQVQSLDDGKMVFSQNADELLNPASNVKLFTAAASLVTLGPDYRFETEFLTDLSGPKRTLYVRGKGDPTITTERLYAIVGELYHTGLREVGDIVIDDSWFDSERLAPGFDQERTDRAYMAPTGAVSLDWNAIGVYLRPGDKVGSKAAAEVDPFSDYFIVDNRLSTGRRYNRRFSVSSEPAGERQRIIVRGLLPLDKGTIAVWKKIDNPPFYFGYTLKRLLSDRGVKVKGRVKLGPAPTRSRALFVAQSETFDLILKRLNKISSNFIAEQLIKTLGAEVKGPPGTFFNGIQVVEDFLERDVGIPRGTYVMKNGSGLNDTNRFAASQLVRVLYHMFERFPLAPEYLSSMGIAGKDGTLRYRFEGSDAVGRLRGKTGTLEKVNSLSGYVQSVGGEKFCFAMIANEYVGRSSTIIQGLDALGTAVAASGSPQGPEKAVAAVMRQDSVVGSIEEATSRIRTYLSVGKQGDKRNIPFLRTAWRTEKDPAVRAVVAEALYQSNPEDYLGLRALLDSFTVSDSVYGRLKRVAHELGVEVPCISSIMELAAEGNADALARAVEIGRASESDETAKEEVSVALAEVGRTAPEELVAALQATSLADQDLIAARLAHGLVKLADPNHPLLTTLRRMSTSGGNELGGFARRLEASLSSRMAQEREAKSAAAKPTGDSGKPTSSGTETRPGG